MPFVLVLLFLRAFECDAFIGQTKDESPGTKASFMPLFVDGHSSFIDSSTTIDYANQRRINNLGPRLCR